MPRDASGRIVLAVDVSNWLRPDAATAPGRSFCQVHGRGKNAAQMIPGRPYSFVAEHTFRFWKQTLGRPRPRLRDPEAADRWTWLTLIAYTQLRPARTLATDLRHPWERPAPTGWLTPARVRRGFRHLRAKLPVPAGVPKPTRPGPGRRRAETSMVSVSPSSSSVPYRVWV